MNCEKCKKEITIKTGSVVYPIQVKGKDVDVTKCYNCFFHIG